jgi:hypothetical protein
VCVCVCVCVCVLLHVCLYGFRFIGFYRIISSIGFGTVNVISWFGKLGFLLYPLVIASYFILIFVTTSDQRQHPAGSTCITEGTKVLGRSMGTSDFACDVFETALASTRSMASP